MLFEKAAKAAYDYKAVYGRFPDKIGIHATQLASLPRCIFFPILPPISSLVNTSDDISLASPTLDRHEAIFEPVVGWGIHQDEVYLPVPGSQSKCVSGEFVAKMAKEFEERI